MNSAMTTHESAVLAAEYLKRFNYWEYASLQEFGKKWTRVIGEMHPVREYLTDEELIAEATKLGWVAEG